jgi:N-acetylmuramoyl-L-alanine amidase
MRGDGTLKKVMFSVITSLAFVFITPFITNASPLAYPVERLAGQDRVDTALSISQKGWTSSQTVILCEYSDFPDSIASTPFAVSQNAPILLTQGDTIDPRIINELQRLNPQKVILLGGSGVLKPSIEKELDQLNLRWERIGGADRYETSILLAKKVPSDSLILANGDDFPDALSAASFAGIRKIPIILTSKTLPDSVLKYLSEIQPEHLIVIGGEGVIPSENLSKNNIKFESRLGGQDRYETNAKVISFVQDTYKTDDLFVASGITFPDAVAGTVLAAKYKAPLLLAEKEDIPSSVYTIMRNHMKIEPPIKNTNDPINNNSPIKELKQGKITAVGGLNLRETPSSTGNRLVTIPLDTTVDLLEQQGSWFKTTYQGKIGWISAEYTTLIVEPQKGTIAASGGLNLRETPSSTGKMLITIPAGTTIELIEQQEKWYKTTYQSKTGWVSADYVTLAAAKTPSASASPSDTTSTPNMSATTTIDLSVNGTVYILGGPGVISLNTQGIIEGKASSTYKDNLRDFPPLPSEIRKPEAPSRGGNPPDIPPTTPDIPTYDPAKEVLFDPFQGIPNKSLAGKTIILDPGHGGPDKGAIGPTGTYEKDNTLGIALALNDILKQAGAAVLFTRNDDRSPAANYSEIEDLKTRVEFANQSKADLFISIHNDAFTNPQAQGTSVFYSAANPKQLESLHLASSIRSSVIDIVQTKDRGVKETGFYVLRNTTMPAILLETAFISNPYEEARLQNATFRKNVAGALFQGIYAYYKNPLPKD